MKRMYLRSLVSFRHLVLTHEIATVRILTALLALLVIDIIVLFIGSLY